MCCGWDCVRAARRRPVAGERRSGSVRGTSALKRFCRLPRIESLVSVFIIVMSLEPQPFSLSIKVSTLPSSLRRNVHGAHVPIPPPPSGAATLALPDATRQRRQKSQVRGAAGLDVWVEACSQTPN